MLGSFVFLGPNNSCNFICALKSTFKLTNRVFYRLKFTYDQKYKGRSHPVLGWSEENLSPEIFPPYRTYSHIALVISYITSLYLYSHIPLYLTSYQYHTVKKTFILNNMHLSYNRVEKCSFISVILSINSSRSPDEQYLASHL